MTFADYSYFAQHWLKSDYGDMNGVELSGDGRINWLDFAIVAGRLGQTYCGGADLTGDGFVDIADVVVILSHWLLTDFGDVGGAELTGDGFVGVDDLGVLSRQWLEGT